MSFISTKYYTYSLVWIHFLSRETQGDSYQEPSLESFFNSLIREKDKLLHLGVINTIGTSNKSLVGQQNYKTMHTKNQNPHNNNKQNKGLKPSHPYSTLNSDKGPKPKGKKTNMHCNFCGKDGHLKSKCFKNTEALEAAMKKHNINVDSYSSNSSSHGHALYVSSLSFNATSTSYSYEWLVDYG
jgi:hypothetical protein